MENRDKGLGAEIESIYFNGCGLVGNLLDALQNLGKYCADGLAELDLGSGRGADVGLEGAIPWEALTQFKDLELFDIFGNR